MTAKKRVLATLAGTVSMFLLGWILYGMLLMDFFASNMGSASNVMRADEDMIFWALIIGNVFQAYLLVYIFSKWGDIKSFGSGLKAGATIGLILAFGIDLVMYATTNSMNLTGTLVDPFVVMVMMGITGGVIGAMLGKE